MLFLSSLDNLLKDANITFQKDVDNFWAQNMLILELFGVGGAVPPQAGSDVNVILVLLLCLCVNRGR